MDARALLVVGFGAAALLAFSRNADASINPAASTGNDVPPVDDSQIPIAPPLIEWGSLVAQGGYMNANDDFRVNDYALYAQAIANAESAYGLPPDLLARLLYMESHYRADIIDGRVMSPVGAAGISQFMPDTAAQYGLMSGGVDGRLDPVRSINAAARYVKALYGMFKPSWINAVAAYNWGPGNMRKYLNGTKTMPQETVNYIAYITPDALGFA